MTATVASPLLNHPAARWQSGLLRLTAIIEGLAFFAALVPMAWLQQAHVAIGMGEMPDITVIEFMIRQSSLFYGAHGVLLWWVAKDVVRYRPLVRLLGGTYLFFGVTFMLVDFVAGAPLWWTLCDPVACGLLGLVLLWLDRKLPVDA